MNFIVQKSIPADNLTCLGSKSQHMFLFILLAGSASHNYNGSK